MTSQAFEAALRAPDNDASNLRLQKLIGARDFSGPALVMVAEKYLRAFYDVTSSYIRRRWIGLALAGMIDASSDVVEQFKQLRHELQGLGAIVLSNTEREGTKIITGLIMRQALEQGIEYSSFWASDKVKNSARNFPEDSDPRWMSKFQTFLDMLGDLALAKPLADPSIIYPVSLVASDGYRWRESNDGLPVALIEAEMLTVVAPDGFLRDIQFVDIPISHIHDMRCQRSTIHDSQARPTEHEPWDLILTLKAKPWTYRLNAWERTGTEVTLLFHHSGDAKEWESGIKEHQRVLQGPASAQIHIAHPMKSSSSPINVSRPPKSRVDGAVTREEHQIAAHAHKSSQIHPQRRHMSSSDHIDISQPRQSPQCPQNEPSQLFHDDLSPSQHRESQRSQQTGSSSVPVEATRKRITMKPAPRKHNVNAAQREISTELVEEQNRASSEDILSAANPLEQVGPKRSASKRKTNSDGKLPRISQTVKANVLKQLRVNADIFEIPPEQGRNARARKAAGSDDALNTKPSSQTQSQGSNPTPAKTTSGARAHRSQTKRKADDDEEFVPDWTPKRRTNARRKTGLDVVVGTKQTKKKARIKPSEDIRPEASGTKSATAGTGLQPRTRSGSTEVQKTSGQRQTKSKPIEKPPLFIASSRHPLIGKLLGTQEPSKDSTAQFKKPKLPIRVAQTPSTPTKPRTQPVGSPARPQTPADARKRPNNESLPLISSSPLIGNAIGGDTDWAHQAQVDTEILSSNSKPVPASPNAESTAISGHADREDVDFEKKRGDIQTAKSDPFRQRHQGLKATSFTRRLTGEEPKTGKLVLELDLSHAMLVEMTDSGSSGSGDLTLATLDQPLPQVMPRMIKDFNSLKVNKLDKDVPAQGTDAHTPVAPAKTNQDKSADQLRHSLHSKQAVVTQASQTPKRKATQLSLKDTEHVDEEFDHNATKRTSIEKILDQAREITIAHEEAPDPEMEDSILTAPQQAIKDTQMEHSAHTYHDVDIDGDTTLVNYDEDEQPTMGLKASPIRFRSSPPVLGSPSSHSSTSAESEPATEPELPTSEAEEMEWEASLQPHQRALHDLLIRTSKRVLRHIVDNETAVLDIADVYVKDGEHVLNSLLERHDGDYDHIFEDMEIKKKSLQKELEGAAKRLAKERRRFHSVV